MKQDTKHNLAVLIFFFLTILTGIFAAEYGQVEGVFAGIFLIGFSHLLLKKWFPKNRKIIKKQK